MISGGPGTSAEPLNSGLHSDTCDANDIDVWGQY
jgi:hypothetical protein